MASVDIPKKARAAVRQGSGEDATAPVKEVDVRMPGKGEILVKINWTGLCASVSLHSLIELIHRIQLDLYENLTVCRTNPSFMMSGKTLVWQCMIRPKVLQVRHFEHHVLTR